MRRPKTVNLSRGMLFTWGMLAGLVFLLAVPQGAGSRMQLAYARVFRWPLSLGHGVTLAARSTTLPKDVTPEEYKDLLANQRQLQNRIANLQAALLDAQRRNEQLARLRQKPGWEQIEIRQARIIWPADQTHTSLVINRGTQDGVADGQFVVSLGEAGDIDQSVGVIGVVSGVGAKTANVRSIAEEKSRVFVTIGALTAGGTMVGLGNGTAKVAMIPRADNKINEGDPVYAQKQPGLDVPVIAARVVSFRPDRDNPLLWDITVEPVYDTASIGDVGVIMSPVRPQ